MSTGSWHRGCNPGTRVGSPRSMLAGLLLCALASSAGPAPAAEAVRFNEVTVPIADQALAFQEAMRLVLVRATGRRDAPVDPAYQPLLADAGRYVQIYRPARAGSGTQVTFDAAALERAIVAAGGVVWPRERPVALVVIVQAPTDADPVAARRALEEAAVARGLPVRLMPAQSAGLAGLAEVGNEAALAAAQRNGADVALVGRGDASGWRWSFHAAQQELEFDGGIAAGIDGAADSLAAGAFAVLAQPELEVLVEVRGVESLRDYADAARLLAAGTGVRSAALVESSGPRAVFRVLVRGGGEGLASALANSARLRVIAAGADRLAYSLERP